MAQEQSRNYLSLGVLILVLAIVGFFVGMRQQPTMTTPSTATPPATEQPTVSTVLKTVSYQGQDGKTALALLEASHRVEKQESDLGTLVTNIDGTGGDANTYWMYYIDGKQATVGANAYVTKNGQTIDWKYEQF